MRRAGDLDQRLDEDLPVGHRSTRKAEVVLGPEPSVGLAVYRTYAARPDELLPEVQRAVEAIGYQIIYVVPDEHRLRFRDVSRKNPYGTDIVCHLERTTSGTRVGFLAERVPLSALLTRAVAERAAARVLKDLRDRDEVRRYAVHEEKVRTRWRTAAGLVTTALLVALFVADWLR